jgi:hypothetical protein
MVSILWMTPSADGSSGSCVNGTPVSSMSRTASGGPAVLIAMTCVGLSAMMPSAESERT